MDKIDNIKDVSSSEVNCEKSLPVNVREQYRCFFKKGKENSKLRILVQAYNTLLQGKKVSYYQSSQFSTITIRILKKDQVVMEGHKPPKKKRRRRRRASRKKKHWAKDTQSICDNSCNVGTSTNQGTLDRQQPFIFSSTRMTYRRFNVKRYAAMESSHAAIPTEHSSPPYSPIYVRKTDKFLRSRNVSMFRRSLSTDYKKKRKKSSVNFTSSDHPKKKLFTLLYSQCTSSLGISNVSVIGEYDSVSHIPINM